MSSEQPDHTERFTDRVEDYIKYRPSYPPGVLDVLRQRANLSPGIYVADIGCGTGISSKYFLDAGCKVIGVEPNAAMREAAVASLASVADFRAVDGTAEQTTLEDSSIDLVIAAQAFHWFDQPAFKAEVIRVLKTGGFLALIWNDRKLEGSPFLEGYEKLLMEYGVDYIAVRHNNISDDELSAFFEPAAMDKAMFPSEQRFDYVGLHGRLMSSSYAPPPEHPYYPKIVAALRHLFDTTAKNGTVVMEYETLMFFGQINPAASSVFGR